MLKSCSSQKMILKEKFKRGNMYINSKSKDKKDKKLHLKESNSSKDSRSKRIETIKEKETELGNICERKGIGEKEKDNDEYFCLQKKNIKSKRNSKNKSQSINKFFLNANQTNPSWNYISYVQTGDGREDSTKKEQNQEKIRVTNSRGSLGFINKSVRQSRVETNPKKKANPQTLHNKVSPKKKAKRKQNGQRKKSNRSNRNKKSKSKDVSNGKKRQEKKGLSKDKIKKDKKNTKLKHGQEKNLSQFGKIIKLQQINFKQLHQDLENEQQNIREYTLEPETTKQRARCLNMLGKICSSMNLKRETHSLAITYVDRFLDSNIEVKAIKTVAIAALMMALKIDHAESVGNIICQFSSNTSFQAVSTTTQLKDQKPLKKKQLSEDQEETPHLRFNLNRPKQPNIFTTVLSCEQIFSEYDHILCKQEIADMEMQMMIKLNFKLAIRSFVYWIDSLTLIWDSFVNELYPSLKMKLFYRLQQNIIGYSHLSQLTQTAFYSTHSYSYSRVLIVLSFMYIITRISLQFGDYREEKGFQLYRSNLSKSPNAIFVDKLGINELFGKFLSLFSMDMGDIVNCCQYVSKFLNHKMLKVYTVTQKPQSVIDPLISNYQYNPQLYRYVFTKLYQ